MSCRAASVHGSLISTTCTLPPGRTERPFSPPLPCLNDLHNPGVKLLLGELYGHLIGLEDDRHIITVAGSRSGKGVSMIIPNLLFYRGSVLVIDPKGELASITARKDETIYL